MAIGFRELIVLMMLSAVPLLLIGVVVWWAVRWAKRSRPIADRLSELEALRRAGTINPDEYEKQRAAIIASV
jgi:cytochrome c-type biogenesis protein CcmH/NrfG